MKSIEDKYFISLAENLKILIEVKGLDIVDIAAGANIDLSLIHI